MSEKRILSVTEALDLAGLTSSFAKNSIAAERGTIVHKACHLADEDDLAWDMLEAEFRPYVEAWKDFRATNKFKIIAAEQEVRDAHGLYLGHPDWVVKITSRSWISSSAERAKTIPLIKGELAILDAKTGRGSVQAQVGLQLAAYGFAYSPLKPLYRFGVQLRPDGSWSLREFPLKDYQFDLHSFFGALHLAHWKLRHSRNGGFHD